MLNIGAVKKKSKRKKKLALQLTAFQITVYISIVLSVLQQQSYQWQQKFCVCVREFNNISFSKKKKNGSYGIKFKNDPRAPKKS